VQLYLPWTLADTPVVAQPSDDNSGELETTTLEEVSASPGNEIDPNDALAYYYLGIIYDDKGMFNEAKTEYKKAIEIDPDYALAHYSLAKPITMREYTA